MVFYSEPNNSKKTWDNINLIINKTKPSSSISEIKVDSKYYTQPTSIANNINNYICNVPRDLAAKLSHKGNKFKSYLPRKTSKFKFSKVSELEVFLLLEGMDKTKSFGLDKIHPFLLQSSAIEIHQPLTFIINLSLKTGVFPESLKIAKVIPIFKQGCRLLCNNYRPISILLALSKIFEKCVLNQITFYFILEGLFTDNQYGFRRERTTTGHGCLVDLIEEITVALDQGEYALSIFLDLSKAFDTVNHSILLTKLIYYGIEDMENQWFDSYLHKRKQRVLVNGIFSDLLMINSGVPQGSILGPFLFLIYINDTEQATKEFSLRLFADDTSLTLTDKNLDLLIEKANAVFNPIYEWLCPNISFP